MDTLLQTLSMQVTYQCNIACKHCGPYCGPKEKDWMTSDEIRNIVSQAAQLGTRTVVFTGGEPSLLGSELPKLIAFVHDQKIANSRVVTNAKFASSYEKAKRVLGSWREAGLVEVNLSCGEYHQEFVPIEYMGNAYRAACDLRFGTVVLAGEFLKPGHGKYEPQMFVDAVGYPVPDLSERSPYSDYCYGMSRGQAMPYGRGRDFVDPDAIDYFPLSKIPSCCDDVLRVFTVHPNGNTTACCGIMVRAESLLNVGNWRQESLEQIVRRAHGDLVLNWIRYRGLRDMKAWLEGQDPNLGLRKEYQNICDLCAELVYNRRAQELLANAGDEVKAQVVQAKIVTDAISVAGAAA